jgi:hypothetical protein
MVKLHIGYDQVFRRIVQKVPPVFTGLSQKIFAISGVAFPPMQGTSLPTTIEGS